MTTEIYAIGGYSEVGRNMTAVRVDDEVVILDMGINVAKIIDYEEEQEHFSTKDMQRIEAIPDDSIIEEWQEHVKAILLTHAHLDHIAAIPYLASRYNCPIIGTPYTIEVLKATLKDKNKKIKNKLIKIKPNSTKVLSRKIKAEFINVTHSIPQTSMIALHTKKGAILYANDYKLDNNPTLGSPPNYQKLKELAPVLCLITNSLYSKRPGHTPSESAAREMLRDVMIDPVNEKHALIVTTFASQIQRIKSAIEFGQKIKRKVILLGRSMYKYAKAAENVNIAKFSDKAKIIGFSAKIKRELKKIQKNRDKYLIICTGNQGETNATLTKMAKGYFNFKPNDHIIFSCTTIPTEPNITQRENLEKQLKKQKVRMSLNIHSSGHCSQQDILDLINMTKPKLIIPAHVGKEKANALKDFIARELKNQKVQLMENGKRLQIS